MCAAGAGGGHEAESYVGNDWYQAQAKNTIGVGQPLCALVRQLAQGVVNKLGLVVGNDGLEKLEITGLVKIAFQRRCKPYHS